MKKRIFSLDVARSFAIICVILVHCIETTYPMDPNILNSYSVFSRIIAISFFCIGRLGVPIFLFLTGYLLLNKTYDTENMIIFYKKKFLPLLITTEIWIIIYYIFKVCIYHMEFDLFLLLRNCFFINSESLIPHLWYMPMILGGYLFLPILANILNNIDKKILYKLLIISITYYFTVPTLSSITQVYFNCPLENKLQFNIIGGGIYGIMLILGYIAKNVHFDIKYLICLSSVSLLLCIGQQYILYMNLYNNSNVWYNSIFILLCSYSLFIIILNIFNNKKEIRIINLLSAHSFSIYITHYIFVILFNEFFMICKNHILNFMFMFIFVSFCSFLLTIIIKKNKVLSHYLLND